MYDGGKIIAGLAVFVGLVTAPVWYGLASGQRGERPELQRAVGVGERCVESTEYMRSWHMDLLDSWRDSVVREGDRVYVASDGQKHNMSLTNSCLGCHAEPDKFCDRCHDYVGVKPYCWDCHQRPAGK